MAINVGIDFMGIARGRRQAENENWQDFVRQQQADEFALEREQRQQKRQEAQWAQEAARYLSSMPVNRQRAADAGINPVDYLISQRQQTLADPNFQQYPEAIQGRILNSMRDSVLLTIQDAQRRGDVADANRLARAYGLMEPSGRVDLATYSGDMPGLLAEAGLTADAEGMVTLPGGVRVPAVIAAANIAQTRTPGSVLLTGAQAVQAAQQRQAIEEQQERLWARRDAEMEANRMLREQQDAEVYRMLGLTRLPNGTWGRADFSRVTGGMVPSSSVAQTQTPSAATALPRPSEVAASTPALPAAPITPEQIQQAVASARARNEGLSGAYVGERLINQFLPWQTNVSGEPALRSNEAEMQALQRAESNIPDSQIPSGILPGVSMEQFRALTPQQLNMQLRSMSDSELIEANRQARLNAANNQGSSPLWNRIREGLGLTANKAGRNLTDYQNQLTATEMEMYRRGFTVGRNINLPEFMRDR